MTLSEFYRMLHPYCTRSDLKKKGEYVTYMISRIIEEEWESECPVLNSNPSFLRRILNGKDSFPHESATFMLAHIDKERFSDELKAMFEKDSIDSLINLGKELREEGYDNNGSIDSVTERCADLYAAILAKIKDEKSSQPIKKQESVFDEAARAAQELRKMCDRIKPVPLNPPPVVEPGEAKYISELFAAYGSVMGIKEFTMELVSQFGYEEDLADRRIDYYAAETIKRGIKDVYDGQFADQFDVLKKETYDGVKNTARRAFPNGYERMLAVMEQAVRIRVEQYLLSNTKYWIGNNILCGVCHHLVDDGRLHWV